MFGDAPDDDERHQIITGIAGGPRGVVATGIDGRMGSWDGAVWLSPDGLVWDRISVAETDMGGEGDQILWAVTQTDSAIVAVGESAGRPAIWLSQHGVEWHRAPIDGTTDPREQGVIHDIVLGGSVLMAVGSAGASPVPAIWLSADGAMWNRLGSDYIESGASEAAPQADRIMRVAVGSHGVVAVGPTPYGPAVWTSDDGFEWDRMETQLIGSPTATHAVVTDVIWVDDLLVGVGGFTGSWAPPLFAVWVSADAGLSWHLATELALVPHAYGISDTPLAFLTPPLPEGPEIAEVGAKWVVVGNDAVATDEVINSYVQHVRTIAVWMAELTSSG